MYSTPPQVPLVPAGTLLAPIGGQDVARHLCLRPVGKKGQDSKTWPDILLETDTLAGKAAETEVRATPVSSRLNPFGQNGDSAKQSHFEDL